MHKKNDQKPNTVSKHSSGCTEVYLRCMMYAVVLGRCFATAHMCATGKQRCNRENNRILVKGHNDRGKKGRETQEN